MKRLTSFRLTPLMSCLVAASAFAQPSPATDTPANEKLMPAVRAKARVEPSGKDALKADTTSIGKGKQELRDVPQSITVVTEKLIDDRQLDTLKEALKNTSGVSFQAAEGGEEDIRLRGFSLQSTGDIFIDGMRDPAFYERDSFNWDRLEVLRGSASMLFGRGSTGGAVNQVTKLPFAMTQHEVAVTVGSAGYVRGAGDFNIATGPDSALRINVMGHGADNHGAKIDKRGIAPTVRWGIGGRNEFIAGAYYLQSDNNIHYGLPWLSPGPSGSGNFLWPTDPKNMYMMGSDRNHSGTTQAHAAHIHRFNPSNELRTAVRVAEYRRDQRASAVRFAPTSAQPGGQPVHADTFSDATVLQRSGGAGTQLKVMNMDTLYVQSDYSGKHRWLGREHSLHAGVDAAHEEFENFGLAPDSPVLTKPRTTVGRPADGASVDENLRRLIRTRSFDAKAVGIYLQDLVQIAPNWKALAGVRWDRFEGTYRNHLGTGGTNPCTAMPPATQLSRTDSLFSHRFGVLFQPTPLQSYHLSYGTSFNTSGDTYQYDIGSAKADPESSRNIELGAKLDSEDGKLSVRAAVFHSTKYNERNRDDTSVNVNSCNYVLSGQRHAAGIELDLAGRITPQWEVFGTYSFIPSAKVDRSTGAPGTEAQGSRPGLTPRHTGTLWTTYQLTPQWRIGGGLNARSADRPVGLNPASPIVAPRFITGDLMAEYKLGDLSYKAHLTNVTNKHYADYLYRGHYVQGRPRTLQVTLAYKFH